MRGTRRCPLCSLTRLLRLQRPGRRLMQRLLLLQTSSSNPRPRPLHWQSSRQGPAWPTWRRKGLQLLCKQYLLQRWSPNQHLSGPRGGPLRPTCLSC